jgi:hypothetical protein
MYGPITTLRRDNRLVKHIPWTAFKLSDRDWLRVIDARDILEVRIACSLFGYLELIDHRIPISSNSTSHRKHNPLSGAPFPLSKSCNRLGRRSATHPSTGSTKTLSLTASKSYASIILGWTRSPVSSWHSVRTVAVIPRCIFTKPFAVLHPYYKLAYIKVLWGGPEEQAAEIAAGDLNAKDWQDEAKIIVENTVSYSPMTRSKRYAAYASPFVDRRFDHSLRGRFISSTSGVGGK